MITHLLDTSAWIAHLQREPGWKTVGEILADADTAVGISVLSLIELHARLRFLGDEHKFGPIVEDYRELFAQIIPVDEAIVLRAIALRETAPARVPAIDALIAATAAHHAAALVHRDPNLATLPGEAVTQVVIGREE